MNVSKRLLESNWNSRASIAMAIAIALIALLTLPTTLAGAATPAGLDEHTQAFLGPESGYSAVDVEALEVALEAQLPPSASVFLASGRLSPLAKASLILEQAEGSLPRARHHLTVRVMNIEDQLAAAPMTVLFVQLDRYNLGPAVRNELSANVGAEHVAPLSEFGEGPHVSWRFVMHQIMGNNAALITAGRTVIDESEAAAATCLGVDCLSTAGGIEELAVWQEMVLSGLEDELEGLPYEAQREGLPVPAAMLELPAALTYFDPYAAETSSDGIFAEFLIESGLAQDASIDSVFRQGDLFDDSLAAIWQRLLVFSDSDSPQFYAAQAYECRRGESGWAAPGEFCL